MSDLSNLQIFIVQITTWQTATVKVKINGVASECLEMKVEKDGNCYFDKGAQGLSNVPSQDCLAQLDLQLGRNEVCFFWLHNPM